MNNTNTAMGWSVLAGIVLIAAGLLGFLNTSIVGSADNAFLRTDNIHNIVHIVTGLIALYIAFGLRGEQQANAVLGFGILYAIIFVAVLVSPTLFGIFSVAANAPIHVVHAVVAVVSLAIGYMARNNTAALAR
ncbi:MAG TPA: DUF4383 domain-containing protein [Candidatus Limnocylindrales bacterium]|nr:DUF4383 domain-containing protein [Candidatus Limnocylindrales bacterium]